MLIVGEREVAALFDMRDALRAVRQGLAAQAGGKISQPLRAVARGAAGMLGAMPCAIDGVGIGAKLVTFFPGNASRALHTHQAAIAMFDPDTGKPVAIMDGRLITELRTAATSAIATRALGRDGAGAVAVLGTGVQARAHVLALREEGILTSLRVWGRTPATAEALAAKARTEGIDAHVAPDPATACRGADVVCTVTPASAPLFDDDAIAPGTHVNAVGSSAPHMRELPARLVGRARIVVDTIEGGRNEAGDILAAIAEGALPPEPDMVRLCDVVAGNVLGRRSAADVTLFKSLGMAIEDVACAALVLGRARERSVGKNVEL
jgi:alanine dehydrogenase